VFLSCKNKPIGKCEFIGGNVAAHFVGKALSALFIPVIASFSVSFLAINWGPAKLAQQISLDQSIEKWKTIMFFFFKEL